MCSAGEVFHVKQEARTSGPGLAAHRDPQGPHSMFHVKPSCRAECLERGARRVHSEVAALRGNVIAALLWRLRGIPVTAR